MKNLATAAVFSAESDEIEALEEVPFFGFITGTVLSAGLWAVIGVALWVVR